MFSIGEHVIHPGQGVCTVTGFDEDAPTPMIILECKQGHAKTRMMYPRAIRSTAPSHLARGGRKPHRALRRPRMRPLYRAQQLA